MKITIIGVGNIGLSLAKGLLKSNKFTYEDIFLVDLKEEKKDNFTIIKNKKLAVINSDIIFLAVQPQVVSKVIEEIKPYLNKEIHILACIVAGMKLSLLDKFEKNISKVLVMPNTAISECESATCICSNDKSALEKIKALTDLLGKTFIVKEENMQAATIICGCGTAFFMKIFRAFCLGGVEMGFHPEEVLAMILQTALGSVKILGNNSSNPDKEIDKIITPNGLTITALNAMEDKGLSAAIIFGMQKSFNKIVS